MSEKFFVSFNSPQCGWMSIGLAGGGREFHTTTAYTPHANALTEILDGLTSLLAAETLRDEFTIHWSRNPEAFDFYFRREGQTVYLEISQFPTFARPEAERETVFAYEGDILEVCEAFHQTFSHLRDDIETDEFEQNWRQPFPQRAFEKFNQKFKEVKR